jgi:catechol 2,3-dioxygenase-like lactoylglutathione lyase family enzyme
MEAIRARSLDHVALWVGDPDPLASFLCDHLGMHVIERGDDFVLVGVDAREGKLTLFSAEAPREPGLLRRVFLRVGDLEDAVAELPDDLPRRRGEGSVEFDAPEGLALGLVRADGLDYDLDHVVLRLPSPDAAQAALAELGFERRDGLLAVGDRYLKLEPGGDEEAPRPLLNHLALLVDSAEQVRGEAEQREMEIDRVVDAENTLAVFVRGPAGITVEYVEHKPTFSLT